MLSRLCVASRGQVQSPPARRGTLQTCMSAMASSTESLISSHVRLWTSRRNLRILVRCQSPSLKVHLQPRRSLRVRRRLVVNLLPPVLHSYVAECKAEYVPRGKVSVPACLLCWGDPLICGHIPAFCALLCLTVFSLAPQCVFTLTLHGLACHLAEDK